MGVSKLVFGPGRHILPARQLLPLFGRKKHHQRSLTAHTADEWHFGRWWHSREAAWQRRRISQRRKAARCRSGFPVV